MSNIKKIQVIVWESEVDVPLVYRLDSAANAVMFFKHVQDNVELNDTNKFHVEELTKKEWDECVKAGKELA